MTIQKQRFFFRKQEHLCSRKVIEKLFESGKAISETPIRFVWMETPNTDEKVFLKIAISVPKKNFKKAVDRNKIKRQIREAYRLNKHLAIPAIESSGLKLSAMFIYTGRKVPNHHEIEAKIIVTLQRLAKEACKN